MPPKKSILPYVIAAGLIFVFKQSPGQSCKDEVNTLLEQSKATIPSNLNNTILLGQQAAEKAKNCQYIEGQSTAYKQIGTAYFYFGKFDSTKKYWSISRELLLPVGGKLLADANNNMGILYQKTGKLDSSLFFHYQALTARKAEDDTLGIASSYFNMASIYRSVGEYSKSLGLFLEAISFYEKLGLQDKIAETNNSIGLIYLAIEEYEKAQKYLELALEQKRESSDERSMASTLTNLASLHMKLNNLNLAEDYYLKAASIFEKYKDLGNLAGISSNLGILYKELGQYEQAIKYYQLAETQMLQIGDFSGLTMVKLNLGAVYYLKNDYQNAENYYEEGLQMTEKNKNLSLEMTANQGLAKSYEKLGKYKEAMECNLRYVAIKDSLFKLSTAEKIAELSEEYEAEKRLREIKELETDKLVQEKSNQRKKFIIWIISILGIGMVTVLLLQLNRFRLKRRMIQAQKERLELDNKLKTKELDSKNRELATYASNAVQMSKFLQDLKDQLDKTDFKETDPALLVNELKKSIDNNLESEDEWEKFKMHFEGVHANFFSILKEKFPELTVNDLKNCAYIKMNLNVKEVAVLMNISPKSAKMNRYRLKKKMALSESDSLTSFIQNL